MNSYHDLTPELQNRIRADRKAGWANPYAASDDAIIRRKPDHDKSTLWRPAYVRDIEKILHLPYYNRYADKTQVFSFYHNDDITRRALHVQLVSRIARNIGSILGLNLDLIEAISLGHDIGHTPFGHAGEHFLSSLLHEQTGLCFNHNIQSARVLDQMFLRNLSVQTLDGIICHNGEFEQQKYVPTWDTSFETFDQNMKDCYTSQEANKRLTPATLEGCVMRISDIIAYLGKDRQDAVIAHIIPENYPFQTEYIGSSNAMIINNLIVDIIENSYGHDYIAMSSEAYQELKTAKNENYKVIYQNKAVEETYKESIGPMFEAMYHKLLKDVSENQTDSIIFKHHINFMDKSRSYYQKKGQAKPYRLEDPNLIVVDYIASMTDDYFIELFQHLFPNSEYRIQYHSYFE